MKQILFFIAVLIPGRNYAQCPASILLTGQGNNCVGTTLSVSTSDVNPYSKIVWYNGNSIVNTVIPVAGGLNSGITVAGGNGPGPSDNQVYPSGLSVDASGNIYVVDVNNNRVQKWAVGAGSGVTVAGGNGIGSAANQFNYPTGLAVDGNGTLYIADAENNRIQKWVPGASSGITVAGGNGPGNAPNQLNDPLRVAVDAAGNVYVGDNNNFRIQKWAPGSTSGVTVAGGNGGGSAANQFFSVYGLFVDANDNIYIADDLNNRIQKWAPGSMTGTTVAGGNGYGFAANQLGGPIGLFVDSYGNIFIGDYAGNRIQKWAPGASSGITVAGGNGRGSATDQLYDPEALYVDNKGNIYISDAANFRVQKWVQLSTIDNTYTALATGTYTASITDGNGCKVITNAIVISGPLNPTIQITASDAIPCTPQTYTATVTDAGPSPSYQWQVNGVDAGTGSTVFSSPAIAGNDIISCNMNCNGVCTSTPVIQSNSIVAAENSLPSIDPSQVFSLPPGQTLVLEPVVSGDISSYLWTPGTGLSDSTIRDPVASPHHTSIYKLQVSSAAGCKATADITVKVAAPVKIPNAFTPNGDGKNDVFYILGGPDGSSIRDFSVFNRWGDKIFQVRDVLPNDPSFGWDGNYKGHPVPTGTYVYAITVRFADNTRQVYEGTVVLIR